MFEDILTPENLINFNTKYNKHWKNIKKKYHSPNGRKIAMNRIFGIKKRKPFDIGIYSLVDRNKFEEVMFFGKGE